MDYVLIFAAGFALAVTAMHNLERRMWDRGLGGFACATEGKAAVWQDGKAFCADLSDAYPSDEALARIVDGLRPLAGRDGN